VHFYLTSAIFPSIISKLKSFQELIHITFECVNIASFVASLDNIQDFRLFYFSPTDNLPKVSSQATKSPVKEHAPDVDMKSPVTVKSPAVTVKSTVVIKSPAIVELSPAIVTQNYKNKKRSLPDDFDSPPRAATASSAISWATKKTKLAENATKSPKPAASPVSSESIASGTKLEQTSTETRKIDIPVNVMSAVDMLLAATQMTDDVDSPVDILTDAPMKDEPSDEDDKYLVEESIVHDMLLLSEFKSFDTNRKIKDERTISVDCELSTGRRQNGGYSSELVVSDVMEEVITNSLDPTIALDHSYSAPPRTAGSKKAKKSRGRPRKSTECEATKVQDDSDDDTVSLTESAIGLCSTLTSHDHTYCHPYHLVPDTRATLIWNEEELGKSWFEL